jgi:uncharacterized NAD-dependent epimerase/dehydratase family protein
VFVVCHEPTRTTMRNVAARMPGIGDVIEATVRMGRLTNPAIRPIGIAINTAALSDGEAKAALQAAEAEYDLPASDPIRTGVGPIVDRIETEFGKP